MQISVTTHCSVKKELYKKGMPWCNILWSHSGPSATNLQNLQRSTTMTRALQEGIKANILPDKGSSICHPNKSSFSVQKSVEKIALVATHLLHRYHHPSRAGQPQKVQLWRPARTAHWQNPFGVFWSRPSVQNFRGIRSMKRISRRGLSEGGSSEREAECTSGHKAGKHQVKSGISQRKFLCSIL